MQITLLVQGMYNVLSACNLCKLLECIKLILIFSLKFLHFSGSDKYIPPSRRSNPQQSAQSSVSPQGITPMNNNGPTQQVNNNTAANNPRNKIYSQNPNSRGGGGGYGVPNNSYHDRRSNYDNRRGPPPNQYPAPGGHNNDGRRMDDNRPQRVPNKINDRRGGNA